MRHIHVWCILISTVGFLHADHSDNLGFARASDSRMAVGKSTFCLVTINKNYKYQPIMYKITWDKETGGVLLHSRIVDGTLGISPRPVFYEELDLLHLNDMGWAYPHSEFPLLWAVNKQY